MSGDEGLDMGGCTVTQYEQVLAALQGDAAAALTLCRVFSTRDRTEEVAFGLNTVFTILSGALVFIMHGGFAMLEAGAIRSKNAMNILLQTVLDGAASAIMWYLVGFGFAYGVGDHPNGFIGDAMFGLSRYASHATGTGQGNWTNWFYQWAFCATAATIPAGAVAERFNFNAYLGYSLFLGGLVYPVVVHWVWCPTGWLGYGNSAPLLGAGMVDFAGSGVVHMVGGLAGLTGAWMVGPRLGRFDMDGRPVPMPGHSAILVVLGTVLLWFGWYGFNPGSALVADNRAAATIAGRAAVTTTLSGAAGGLTCLLLGFARSVAWDLISLCNGMLVGFVAITAGCHVLEPWAALLAGATAAALFEGCCAGLLRLRVDDVVSAGPMHGVCGAWGVLLVGLLAKEEYIRQAYTRDTYPYGLFYGGGGKLLASQVIGLLAIAGWVMATMGLFFLAFRRAGALRISAEEEHAGLDASKHGGSAYHMNAGGGGGGGGGMFGGMAPRGPFANGGGGGGAGFVGGGFPFGSGGGIMTFPQHTSMDGTGAAVQFPPPPEALQQPQQLQQQSATHLQVHTPKKKGPVGDAVMLGNSTGFGTAHVVHHNGHHGVGGGATAGSTALGGAGGAAAAAAAAAVEVRQQDSEGTNGTDATDGAEMCGSPPPPLVDIGAGPQPGGSWVAVQVSPSGSRHGSGGAGNGAGAAAAATAMS